MQFLQIGDQLQRFVNFIVGRWAAHGQLPGLADPILWLLGFAVAHQSCGEGLRLGHAELVVKQPKRLCGDGRDIATLTTYGVNGGRQTTQTRESESSDGRECRFLGAYVVGGLPRVPNSTYSSTRP